MITTTIFPGRYVQGYNALQYLGEEGARFGTQALLLADPFVHAKMLPDLLPTLQEKINPHVELFGGECSDEEIERLVQTGKANRAELVIGIGGGKTLDTAKAVAYVMSIPVIIVPTIASTDAPCSALSVIYTPEGQFKRYLFLPKNPDVVLVDTHIIVQAPARFLISGMGDALATWFEAESCQIKQAPNMTGRLGSMTAYALARLCYETLLTYGVQAVTANRAGVTTSAFEKVVEANTLLSGLGFESGGLAAAHAIHNGLTVLEATHQYYHGEKVAIGTLASLYLTGKSPAIINEVYSFCEAVGLPTTLAEIGLAEVSDEDLMRVAEKACAPGETIHNELGEITPQKVLMALKAADAEGRRRKGK
ncbi:glycerol dehydrogenase [uncultured Thermanaerothrix sp.]|uniref:glycerol dehydrogenase n=1 Tax=uncultured Thermanaerothrix sp. TaxID=1195149 RepID=UPI0026226802|nr:glycerol dehydrogenase [uncultured Thermanaerothrix sp.]